MKRIISLIGIIAIIGQTQCKKSTTPKLLHTLNGAIWDNSKVLWTKITEDHPLIVENIKKKSFSP